MELVNFLQDQLAFRWFFNFDLSKFENPVTRFSGAITNYGRQKKCKLIYKRI